MAVPAAALSTALSMRPLPVTLRRCVGAVLAAALMVAAAPGAFAASATDATVTATGAAAALAPMPTPPDILGYVEIPNVLRLLDRAEAIARKFAPMPMPPGVFRQQVGQMLGDPDFAHLDADRPLVFLATRPRVGAGTPGISLWVPTKDATPYVEKANQSFFVHAQVVDNEGVFSMDPDALDQAVADKEFYDALVTASASAPITADLRWRAGLDRIDVTWHEAALDSLPKLALPHTPGEKKGDFDPAPVLRAESYAGLALLGQSADLQVDVVLDADTIAVDAEITGKPGSDLAAAFAHPANDAAAIAKLLGKGDGAMTVVGAFNGPGWAKLMLDLSIAAAAEPTFATFKSATVAAAFADYGKAFDGTVAMRMGADGDLPLASTVVAGTPDPEAAKAAWTACIALMSSAHIGIISTVIPDARTSGGVKVQRQHVAPDPEHSIFGSSDPAQEAMMASSLHDLEFAFTKHVILGSQVPAHLDAMITASQGGAPLPAWTTAAATAIGPGKDGYSDYDLAAVMKASQKMMSATAPAPGPDFSALPTGHPLMFAWQCADGADRVAMRIPVQVFKDFSDATAKARKHHPVQDPADAPMDGGGADAMPGPDAGATAATPSSATSSATKAEALP